MYELFKQEKKKTQNIKYQVNITVLFLWMESFWDVDDMKHN